MLSNSSTDVLGGSRRRGTLVIDHSPPQEAAMSHALDHPLTEPKDLEVKTHGGYPPVVHLTTQTGRCTIAIEDFLDAAWYILTNTDLEPDDPRLVFIERVRKLRSVPGWSMRAGGRRTRTKRLAIPLRPFGPPRAVRTRPATP